MLEFLAYLGEFLLLINAILFLSVYRKNDTPIKIFSFYLITMFIIQIVVSVFQVFKKNNLYLSHYYFIIQFLFLSIYNLQYQFGHFYFLNLLQARIVAYYLNKHFFYSL